MDQLQDKVWYYTRFQNLILEDDNVDTYEKLCYTVICSFADRNDNTCFPSFNTIADKMGCSRRKAINCVKTLVEAGYIIKTKRKDSKKKNKSNVYKIKDLKYIEVFRKIAKQNNNKEKINERLSEHPIPSESELNKIANKNDSATHSPSKTGDSESHALGSESHALGSESHAPELNPKNNIQSDYIEEEDIRRLREKFKTTFNEKMKQGHITAIEKYINDLSIDIILFAFEKAQMNFANTFNFIVTILKDWSGKKLSTIDEVKDYIENRNSNNDNVRGSNKFKTEEDDEEIESNISDDYFDNIRNKLK